MARNQRGQLPVMSRKQERQTDHADSGRQGYECGWRLSFRPARSALRSWAVGYFGVRVPDLRLPSRSELLSQSTVQRLSADGGALLAQAANRIAGALYGDDEKRLTPEALIAAAAKATRLDAKPLADPRLIEALGALTSSLHKEASLSPFGRLAASRDLKRMLSTLLILADAEREDATIFTWPRAAPIFIAGLPRSGTTFLHGLLAEDPANRAPRLWEAIYPYPKHRAAEFGAGRRMVQLQLRIFNRLSPGLRNLHPIEADAPEECIESLRARSSAARASTTSIASLPIEPGSTRLATTMAIGSLRGSSVIFRDRAKRRDAGS
jgi:hypothetical protein